MFILSHQIVGKLARLRARAERYDKSLVIYPCYEEVPYIIQSWEANTDGIELTYKSPGDTDSYQLLIPGRLSKGEFKRFEIHGLDEDDEYYRIALISNRELQAVWRSTNVT